MGIVLTDVTGNKDNAAYSRHSGLEKSREKSKPKENGYNSRTRGNVTVLF